MKETLRVLRLQNGYSQGVLADYLGVSRQMYSKYENEGIIPPVDLVAKLAKFYRVPYDVIIDNKLSAYDSLAPSDSCVIQKSSSVNNKRKDVTFNFTSEKELEVACPVLAASSTEAFSNSFYVDTVLGMLPKLIYAEQLRVLAKLSEMIHQETEEKLDPSKTTRMAAFNKILELNKELHLSSEGQTWTREELHERGSKDVF